MQNYRIRLKISLKMERQAEVR